jgi:hypothetical protein
MLTLCRGRKRVRLYLLALLALPVQKNLLTGIWITEPRAGSGDETLLTCFTSTKALAYWYKSTCLLVQKHEYRQRVRERRVPE